MEALGLIGLSWRHADPGTVARFTVPPPERPARLPALRNALEVPELFYLATCNRVEVAFAVPAGADVGALRPPLFAALTGREPLPGEAERLFRVWGGDGVAEHLALVAAGLDSVRVGETEILGQVRAAYEECRRLGLLGPWLEALLPEILKIGARVQRAVGNGGARISLAEIALRRVAERLKRTPGPVALVGVSAMTERCARELAAQGVPLVWVNRSAARLKAAAQAVGARPRTLAAFQEDPDPVEAAVLATGSPAPVLRRPHLERLLARTPSGEPPLLVDLAVPPDVDPEEARAAGVERVGMEAIVAEAEATRAERLTELADARLLVDQALLGVRRRLLERMVAPVQAALHRRFRRTAAQALERLRLKEGRTWPPEVFQSLERWAATLAARFAYLPSAGLRGLVHRLGPEALEAFLGGLDPETLTDLQREAERAEAQPQNHE